MWPHVVEAMLGCWLILSPFIFAHPAERPAWWINDMASGSAIIAFALVSYWPPLKRMHLASIAVALWLIGFGYFSESFSSPAMQNDMVLGLLIGMLAIIPSEANRPPDSWREFRGGKS
ncbi:MAG: hypothetical protein WD851_18375 [Pirellulales bacterium]